MSAYDEMIAELEPGETVEAIVFGAWGWGSPPGPDGVWPEAYGEPMPPPVPLDMRGRCLSQDDARPFMQSWDFRGGFGAPACYAVRVWTNRRVMWVTQYDGATALSSAPRHPVDGMPGMPGGG